MNFICLDPDVRHLLTPKKLTDDQAIWMVQLEYEIVRLEKDCIYGANDCGFVDINRTNNIGFTALMEASSEDDRDIVRFLLTFAPPKSSKVMCVDINYQK